MKDAFKKEPSKRLGKLAAMSVKPPCINCKRAFGTIFTNRENDKYIAICGNKTNPCNLNIKIYNGKTVNLPYILNVYNEEIMDVKNIIIRQKLDTLFNYVSEEKSVQMFKKELETYNANSRIYKELLDKYNDLYENEAIKEMLAKKNRELFFVVEKIGDLLKEYERTENKTILQTAMHIQINEIYPEIRNMRLLKNEVLELNQYDENKYKIFTYPVALSKIDYDFGEKATVLKFQRK
jgi:hypothetical protein